MEPIEHCSSAIDIPNDYGVYKDKYFCMECDTGLFWKWGGADEEKMGCVGHCDELDPNALECTNDKIITLCKDGYFPSGNGDYCQEPILNCVHASGNVQPENLMRDASGEYYCECGRGFFWNVFYDSCTPCFGDNCLDCNRDECFECADGWMVAYDGQDCQPRIANCNVPMKAQPEGLGVFLREW